MIDRERYTKEEAAFMAASYWAEQMVNNASVKVLGADKYEFIHRCKNYTRQAISYATSNVFIKKDDIVSNGTLNFNPSLEKFISDDSLMNISWKDGKYHVDVLEFPKDKTRYPHGKQIRIL